MLIGRRISWSGSNERGVREGRRKPASTYKKEADLRVRLYDRNGSRPSRSTRRPRRSSASFNDGAFLYLKTPSPRSETAASPPRARRVRELLRSSRLVGAAGG